MRSTEMAGLQLLSLHPLVYIDSQEGMLTVFLLTCKIMVPIRIF